MAGNIKVEGIELEVKTNASQAAAELSKAAKATKSYAKAAETAEKASKALAEGLQETTDSADKTENAFPKFERDLKRVKTASKTTTDGLTKVSAAFKRILFYRIVRSVIKEITQAFKEGVENAYQYSKAISGPLAKNMDALATSFLYLKNGLGAGLAPIINALTPIITALADAIANLGNTIAGFIAALTGQSTFIKAIKNMTEYADATKGAAKAQRQLLGFDELNVLSAKGGSGGSSVDYSKMFETVNTSDFINNIGKSFANLPNVISTKIQEALAKISETIQSVNWFEVPGKIAEKLSVAFQNFDFKGVFGSIGKLIGSALTGAISFVAGSVWTVFKDYINEELGGLDENASILEKGWAIAKGIFKGLFLGILDGAGNIINWVKDNIVTPFWQGLESGIVGTILEQLPLQMKWKIATKWAEFKHWFKDTIGAVFTTQFWQDKWENIWNGLTIVIEWIKVTWNNLKSWFKDNPIKTAINKSDSISIGGFGGSASVTAWASGGYPAQGSMFLAGEAGPELVSQVGGRTGVINNDTFGAIVSTAAENIINAVLASGQATAEAAREGGNMYVDGTLVTRQLYGKFQAEGTRKGGSAVQFVGV